MTPITLPHDLEAPLSPFDLSPFELNRRTLLTLMGAAAVFAGTAPAAAVASEDPLADLIARRRLMLAGDGSAAAVPELAEALKAMSGSAAATWKSMITPSGTSGLWADLPLAGIGSAADATGNMGVSFNRIYELALAYSTAGSEQHGDTPSLRTWFQPCPT